MNLKLRNWFFVAVFFVCMGILIPTKIYAVQGQLNYDIGSPSQEIVTVEDTKAIQECNRKLDAANLSNTELLTQKKQCQDTNTLLNKAMKEAVDQTIKQKNLYKTTLIITSIIACAFFLSTLILLMKMKKKKIEPSPPVI